MYSPIKAKHDWWTFGAIKDFFGFPSISESLSGLLDNPEAISASEGREFSSVIASGRVTI